MSAEEETLIDKLLWRLFVRLMSALGLTSIAGFCAFIFVVVKTDRWMQKIEGSLASVKESTDHQISIETAKNQEWTAWRVAVTENVNQMKVSRFSAKDWDAAVFLAKQDGVKLPYYFEIKRKTQ